LLLAQLLKDKNTWFLVSFAPHDHDLAEHIIGIYSTSITTVISNFFISSSRWTGGGHSSKKQSESTERERTKGKIRKRKKKQACKKLLKDWSLVHGNIH